ncbi:NAD(P)H-dependent flavin oxidoreductase [Corynebacterium parakroppenstedtii]|uniref:NAD(P)H-dependent flavin oxidoreductase n=1 Tax=Corynebacterium parakroppenstedtii TaxID=2828363 RepID=UPI0030ED9C4E
MNETQNTQPTADAQSTVKSRAFRPIIAAPMAGGPSSPALVDAVAAHGGLGFLAAGYKTPEAVDKELDDVARRARQRGAEPFYGLNLFVPQPSPSGVERDRAEAYRDELAKDYERFGVVQPDLNWTTDDQWEGKLAVIRRRLDQREQQGEGPADADSHAESVSVPDVLSFTFGLPPEELVDEFQSRGIEVWATVATTHAAQIAGDRGVAAIVVQGPEAGGHRATTTPDEEPGSEPLMSLVGAVSGLFADADADDASTRPAVIAAGGIATPDHVAEALRHGADAVAAGTIFAATDEAGTNEPYKQALISATADDTVITRAYSGRPARGRRNAFIDAHSDAPLVYPAVNGLTSPIRKAATKQGETDCMSLWAGQSVEYAHGGTAGSVVDLLLQGR